MVNVADSPGSTLDGKSPTRLKPAGSESDSGSSESTAVPALATARVFVTQAPTKVLPRSRIPPLARAPSGPRTTNCDAGASAVPATWITRWGFKKAFVLKEI